MARILALDFGKKRTGIAVTDPQQLIATALDTVPTGELIGYLKKYFAREPVSQVLIGYPLHFDDTPTDATPLVDRFIPKFQHVFPDIPIIKVDETLTSVMASRLIAASGRKKKEREEKGLTDRISALVILREYLNH